MNDPHDDLLLGDDLVLADLVSHVLDRGAVVAGEVVISLAGVDLVNLGLRLYVTSAETARRSGMGFLPSPPPASPPVHEGTPPDETDPR